MKVASWNLKGRSGSAAASLGSLLRDLGGADLVLLQEASPKGIEKFSDAAGLDWVLHIRDVAPEMLSAQGRSGKKGGRGRPRSVALAGRGNPARCPVVFPDVPLPEKVMAASVDLDGVTTTVVTYHAPTKEHQLKKPDQAVRLARWLASVEGPVVLGGDFNTPKVDPPDQRDIRTHYHSGDKKLKGLPGEDLLVGPEPIHGLRDVLRLYLADRPDELDMIRADRPDGPLATSYRGTVGERKSRYDAIWVSSHFTVASVEYVYDEAIEAGTDHGLVLAGLLVGS
jgi:endonuclease/exonuclease/phosphatase family metal-dependent hydrolase